MASKLFSPPMVLALCYCCLFWARVKAKVPAIYVFGDSLADVGNNNYLELSFLKANFPHNGVDYPGRKATGRFSNGKNFADFLGTCVFFPFLSSVIFLQSSLVKFDYQQIMWHFWEKFSMNFIQITIS